MTLDQEIVIDKLMDIPNVTEQQVFAELIKVNRESMLKMSSYILCKMWNNHIAVKSGMVKAKTANDFM